MSSDNLCGVLLVNTGTPDSPTPDAVRSYLSRFLMDDHIVPMNKVVWWFILHMCILPKRSYASAEKYKTIWTDEGSPFTLGHQWLEEHLSSSLGDVFPDTYVRVAMSYSDPFIGDVLKDMKDAHCDSLIVLPLYPQSARSTTGSVKESVSQSLKSLGWNPRYHFIENYHDDSAYIKALAKKIKDSDFSYKDNDRILFSFHSIPLVDIERGDTYDTQIHTTCEHIASELGIPRESWDIGFQCQFDKGRTWLSPFSRNTLSTWAKNPPRCVYMVCPNFAVDCLETIYDVGSILKPWYYDALCEQGYSTQDRLRYIDCLGPSEEHLEVLIHVLKPHLSSLTTQ